MQTLAQIQMLSAASVMLTHNLTIHLMSDFHLRELAVDNLVDHNQHSAAEDCAVSSRPTCDIVH